MALLEEKDPTGFDQFLRYTYLSLNQAFALTVSSDWPLYSGFLLSSICYNLRSYPKSCYVPNSSLPLLLPYSSLLHPFLPELCAYHPQSSLDSFPSIIKDSSVFSNR